jgi:cytoskeletal protein RodZ
MYKLAVAILLLSAPAFAQDNSENKPNMPPTNMKNTVIPKSGGEQTPATTPTTAAQANSPGTTAARPAKTGPEQTSVPNAASPATTTQTTGESNQSPTVKKYERGRKEEAGNGGQIALGRAARRRSESTRRA